MFDYRDKYGLTKREFKRCAECGTEHRGRCHFVRNRKHNRANVTVEQIRDWNARKKVRRLEIFTRSLIRELCDAVDEGRRSARRANRSRPPALDGAATDHRRDRRVAKKHLQTGEKAQ